jgi:hypothetical protein
MYRITLKRRFTGNIVMMAVVLSTVVVAGVRAAPLTLLETSELIVETAKGRFAFTVELARTWEQKTQGLQGRHRLASNAGMLFDYQPPQLTVMWMKNTYLALDIIFIAADGRIINIVQRTTPLSPAKIRSDRPARAVLEVNAGTVAWLGILPGNRVLHPIFGVTAR